MNHQDVVIIGGGVAGLTAASYLAQAGRRVTLLEKSKAMGGRAQTQQKDGFHYNMGPHALYQGDVAMAVLDELGVSVAGKKPPLRGTAVYQNQLYALPLSPKDMFATRLLTAREKAWYMRVMAGVMKIDPDHVHHLTVDQWIAQQTDKPKLQQLLRATVRVTTYANASDQFSAAVFLHQLKLALQSGVVYVDYGWQSIVDQLCEKAVQMGVTIRTKANVVALTNTDTQPILYLANGEQMAATAVLLTTPPQVVNQLLPTPILPTPAPIYAACLDVALSRLPYRDVLFALGIEQPTYYSVHSATAQLAPDQQALIHLAKYLGPDDNGDGAKEMLMQMLDLLQPRWRDVCIRQTYRPQMVVVEQLWRAGEKRPSVTMTQHPAIFLAGDWVGEEGWLVSASFSSARRAAKMIVQQTKVGAFA